MYVSNLDWDASWQQLKDHMKIIGPVTRADVLTTPDGKSKGCGLVEFANARDAAEAIRRLNNSIIHGRTIQVREDREAKGPLSFGGYGARGAPSAAGRRIYVGNVRMLLERCKSVVGGCSRGAVVLTLVSCRGASRGTS